MEDAAYSRLIRKYYATERPLPCEVRAIQRLVGARTDEEREAVEIVLEEFFLLEEDGWHNVRCDREIAKFREGDAERQQKAQHERERLRRHREERARLFALLREAGVTPKWDTPTAKVREMVKRLCPAVADNPMPDSPSLPPLAQQTCNAPETVAAPLPATACNAPDTANQAPDTNPQAPEVLKAAAIAQPESRARSVETPAAAAVSTTLPAAPEAAPDPTTLRAIEITAMLRKRGAALQASDPRVRHWAATGVSDASLLTALERANERRAQQSSPQPVNSGLIAAILSDILAPQAEPGCTGQGHGKHQQAYRHRQSKTEALANKNRENIQSALLGSTPQTIEHEVSYASA